MSKGTVKILSEQIASLKAADAGEYALDLMRRRAFLLTNGGQPPIPQKFLNQRQKRKRNRQTGNYGRL